MARSSADLVINLAALAQNWLTLKNYLSPASDCGAVVKAEAYGLGVEPVLRALVNAGCRTFYVAYIDEALVAADVLRALELEFELPAHSLRLLVLLGCEPGDELEFLQRKLEPVLISEEMLLRWLAALENAGIRAGSHPVALKIDSGMGRLGLEPASFERLLQSSMLQRAGIELLMSHLACADEAAHPMNKHQLASFANSFSLLKKKLPAMRGSLANSAGIYLGSEYHFDAVRPGIALYGGGPEAAALRSVVQLSQPVIQVRELPEGGAVGYGACHTFDRPARVAIVAGGYADGLLRSMSGTGKCWFASGEGSGGWYAPIVGRVSMDSVIVDISDLPEGAIAVGQRAELIGEHVTLSEVASAAGTISYEILTSLGKRYRREYYEGAHDSS